MTDDTEEFNVSLLPAELAQLAPLLQRFGVGDDLERANVIVDRSTGELRDLVEAVSPHWAAINGYIDENMQPPGPRQDLAIALGDFAQAALEAELELQRRGTST